MLLYMCPHAAMYVSSYYCMCVLIQAVSGGGRRGSAGARFTCFTCFTSTKVQVLTQEEEVAEEAQVRALLALLVQKYKY